MVTSSKCPDPVHWNQLLDSRLPEPEAADLGKHLEGCANCQSTLEHLTTGEAGWAEAARASAAEARPALARAMQQLKAQDEAGLETPMPAAGGNDTLPFLRPSQNPERLGRLGPYEVIGVIGRGGMGVVLKALDPALQRLTAIKILAPQWASHAQSRQRFEREARAAALVRHENVVAIHAVDEVEGLPCLVMEYVPGMSLQQHLDRGEPLELEEILRIGAQVAAGLAAAHQQGLIHRDIKPANILLDSASNVRLTDFGLARAVDDTTLTQTGVIAGTPQYMSPEQARGAALDHRADLFSLGSVLYAMCTGKPPFRAPTTVAVLRRVCDEMPPDVRDLNPDIPDWLAEIIERLHAKRPRERFDSAGEVARLLSQHPRHRRSFDKTKKPAALGSAKASSSVWWVAVLAIVAAAALPLVIWGVVVLVDRSEPTNVPQPREQVAQNQGKPGQAPPQGHAPQAQAPPHAQAPQAQVPPAAKVPPQGQAPPQAKMSPQGEAPVQAKEPPQAQAPPVAKVPPQSQAPPQPKMPPQGEAPVLAKASPAAKVPPQPQGEAPRAEGDVFLQKLRADLDDENVLTRRDALMRLATMQPNKQRAEIAKKLVELSAIDNPHIRRHAVTALGMWGSKDEVPALMKALEHDDSFTRREALKVIGRFRDPQTLAPVIRCFRDFLTRADAEQTLRELGAMAEAEVLPLLKERDVFLKKAAIGVLADIGSQASVPALTEAAASGNRHLVEPAQQALAAIAGRKKN